MIQCAENDLEAPRRAEPAREYRVRGPREKKWKLNPQCDDKKTMEAEVAEHRLKNTPHALAGVLRI